MTTAVFIYALVDPRTDAIKYVGRSENVQRRTRAHKTTPTNPEMAAWLQELGSLGLEPRAQVLEKATNVTCDEAEVRWINEHRATVLNVFSASLGGAREGSGRKAPVGLGPAKCLTFKLYQSEIDSLREICAELEITQADVMRMGMDVATYMLAGHTMEESHELAGEDWDRRLGL